MTHQLTEEWIEKLKKNYEFAKASVGREKSLSDALRDFSRDIREECVEEVEKMADIMVVNALFDNDMKWTLIYEKIKMMVPISPKDGDYYMRPFLALREQLKKWRKV